MKTIGAGLIQPCSEACVRSDWVGIISADEASPSGGASLFLDGVI